MTEYTYLNNSGYYIQEQLLKNRNSFTNVLIALLSFLERILNIKIVVAPEPIKLKIKLDILLEKLNILLSLKQISLHL